MSDGERTPEMSGSQCSGYRLRTAGIPELSVGGTPIQLSAKALALLVYLRLNAGRAMHRDVLVDLFWPPRDTDMPKDDLRRRRTSLRMALSELRRVASADEPLIDCPTRSTVVGSATLPCDAWPCLSRGEGAARGAASAGAFLEGWPEASREREFAAWVERIRSGPAAPAVTSIAGGPTPPPHSATIQSPMLDMASARRPRRARRAVLGVATLVVAFIALALARALASRSLQGAVLDAQSAICRDGNGRATLVDEVWRSGSVMKAQHPFTRVWTLQNVGTCAWSPDFLIRFVRHAGADRPLSETQADRRLGARVPPGARIAIRIMMRASPAPGRSSEDWALLDASSLPIRIDESDVLPTSIVTRQASVPSCTPGSEVAELTASNHVADEVIAPAKQGELSWSVRNSGACSWPPGFAIHRLSNTALGPLSHDASSAPSTDTIAPGDKLTFRVPMTSPVTPGRYEESWEILDPRGRRVAADHGRALRVSLVVPGDREQPRTIAPLCQEGEERASFVSETIEDDAELPGGSAFVKVWTLFNRGACRWRGRTSMVFLRASRARMSSVPRVMTGTEVLPNTSASFAVRMQAPAAPGNYREIWQLRSEAGHVIPVSSSDSVWVSIIVPARLR